MRSAALALVLLAAPLPSGAQEARRYFEAGNAAFALGRYGVAATAFEEAYRASALPETAFSAAQAYRRQYWVDGDPAHLRRAQELYREYLAQVPTGGRREHAVTHLQTIELVLARLDPAAPAPSGVAAPTQLMIVSRTPGARAGIDGGALSPVPVIQDVSPGAHTLRVEAAGWFGVEEHWIAVDGRLVVIAKDLTPRPAWLFVRAPAGASIAIDEASPIEAPMRRAVRLQHGTHRVVASAPGHVPFVRSLELTRGERAVVDVRLSMTVQRRVSWWLLGGAGVTLAGALVTGSLALAAESRASSIWDQHEQARVPLTGPDLVAYQRDVDRRDDLRGITIALGAGTLALAASWALLFALDAPSPE